MVKDHSDREKERERGNPLPGCYFRLAASFFYMNHPTDRISHSTARRYTERSYRFPTIKVTTEQMEIIVQEQM